MSLVTLGDIIFYYPGLYSYSLIPGHGQRREEWVEWAEGGRGCGGQEGFSVLDAGEEGVVCGEVDFPSITRGWWLGSLLQALPVSCLAYSDPSQLSHKIF